MWARAPGRPDYLIITGRGPQPCEALSAHLARRLASAARCLKHPVGLEPTPSVWKTDVLPLNTTDACRADREPPRRAGLEPTTSPVFGADRYPDLARALTTRTSGDSLSSPSGSSRDWICNLCGRTRTCDLSGPDRAERRLSFTQSTQFSPAGASLAWETGNQTELTSTADGPVR